MAYLHLFIKQRLNFYMDQPDTFQLYGLSWILTYSISWLFTLLYLVIAIIQTLLFLIQLVTWLLTLYPLTP